MSEFTNLETVLFTGTQLSGTAVVHYKKTLAALEGIFEDREAFSQMDGDQIVYEVDSWMPVANDTEGGLFFGITHLYPGLVGDEYFMTKGHFHTVANRAEYYWTTEGEGLLLLMDKDRNTRAERMFKGSLHYIPGYTAHRVVNPGKQVLRFGACWPADAGHDYETITRSGFSKRVKKIADSVQLV